jgi:hypothetical protein
LIVVQQAVADPAHAAAFELDVKRVGQKLAGTHMGAAVDASVLSGFIAGGAAVEGIFDHGHLTVGYNAGRPLAGVACRACVGIGDRDDGLSDFGQAHVGKGDAFAAAFGVHDAAFVGECGLGHGSSPYWVMTRAQRWPRSDEAYISTGPRR